jgi:peptidyl-prolyl cis-trans isomerase A (cyclophilin A)
MRLRYALLATLAFAGPLNAQTTPPSPPTIAEPAAMPEPAAAVAPKPATVTVRLQTSEGPLLLELEKDRAPITTANFLRYVDAKRLDNTTFYRAMKLGSDTGLIQGGIKGDGARAFPPIAHEPTSKTGILHTDATISLARLAPGTGRADFFITVGAVPFLDAHPDQPGDNSGYAAFGHVVEGMDIVRRILAAPTSPTAGVGAMKGQMIAAPIRILTARRSDPQKR